MPQHHQQQPVARVVGSSYGLLLAVCAPPLLLFGLGVVPSSSKLGLPLWGWLLCWAGASAALLLLQALARRRDGHEHSLAAAAAVEMPLAGVPLVATPRACVLLYGTWAFLMSMVWMELLAAEVAALFEALGLWAGVGEDLLGATLLAWGESFPDLMSSVALARNGNSAMALAASFGGPTLNLLVGTGASVLAAALRHGRPMQAGITPGIVVLVLASAVALVYCMIAPRMYDWRLGRPVGLALLAGYALALVLLGASGLAAPNAQP